MVCWDTGWTGDVSNVHEFFTTAMLNQRMDTVARSTEEPDTGLLVQLRL